jgi:adenylate kinase family enzyme
MMKVAVFGNAGGGKSTLARKIAGATGLPLCPIDTIQFRPSGPVPREEYLVAHTELLKQDSWIIDGFGCVETAWQCFAQADTLVYVDLPLTTHFWWVTKRLVQGHFRTPEGWPEGSPIWRSSLSSYRVLWLCHRRLTPRYRQLVRDLAVSKRVHHLRSAREIAGFVRTLPGATPHP